MKPVVFIQANASQLLGAKVAEYALKKRSKDPARFDVRIMYLNDFPQLVRREGMTYRRKGRIATWHNRDLQSFSPLRFLPPQLMGYRGRALVIDPDIFAVADVLELLERDMNGKSILCRYVEPGNGRNPFYATSVILLDCSKLVHWQWDKQIDEMFAHKWDYGDWISLGFEPKESIGLLEEEWNHFDILNEKTKLLHNTERLTQPWKTGLPVDFNLNYSLVKSGFLKRLAKKWLRQMKLGRLLNLNPEIQKYAKHPDSKQELFFFSLLREALEDGDISLRFLRSEIKKQHLRPDAFTLIRSVQSELCFAANGK